MKNESPLIFYVQDSWRGKGIHVPFLNPWWGNPLSESSLFTKELYDNYSFDTSYYTITDDISKADMVLAPYQHVWFLRHNVSLFDECVAVAQKANLPILIDGTGDVEYPINIPGAYILRYGGYRFISEKGRIEIPPASDDLLERVRNGQLSFREKIEGKPVVGFSGWANLTLLQTLKTFIKQLPVRLKSIVDSRYRACKKGVLWRKEAIGFLQGSSSVEFRAQVRSSFSGSAKTAEGDLRVLREQMVNTILESDYALDVRGDANNSTRLFEILSLGRIPVIVDTERIFPFSDKIDYSSFALIVDFRDLKKLPEKIAAFHRVISPERFIQMQKNAREAYRQYFRIDSLTRMIIEELRAQLR